MIITLMAVFSLMVLSATAGAKYNSRHNLHYKKMWQTATALLEDRQLDALEVAPHTALLHKMPEAGINKWVVELYPCDYTQGGQSKKDGIGLRVVNGKETRHVTFSESQFCLQPYAMSHMSKYKEIAESYAGALNEMP